MKIEFFIEIEATHKASKLSNKVPIDTNASYAELRKQLLEVMDKADEGFFDNPKQTKGKIASSLAHANNMIHMEILIDQMNLLYLFEAVKNNSSDKELQTQLKLAKKQFTECHAKESTYFA